MNIEPQAPAPLWWTKGQSMFSDDVPEIADPDLCPPFDMYALWGWLASAFADAYAKTPRNDRLIGRVYEFAKWCCNQSPGSSAADDLISCVTVCFDEEVPRIATAMADMPRWFSLVELQQFRDATLTRILPAGDVERWWRDWKNDAQSGKEDKAKGSIGEKPEKDRHNP